jgi:hypothetical protein
MGSDIFATNIQSILKAYIVTSNRFWGTLENDEFEILAILIKV